MVDFLNKVPNIDTGTIPNPYRQFAYTLAPGERKTIRYDANFFNVLYTSSENLAVNFSGSGGDTQYWQGLQYNCDYVFSYAELINLDTANPLSVVVGMGIGDMKDNRLAVSGAVKVRPDGSFLPVEIGSVSLNVPIRETGYTFNSAYDYKLNNNGYGEFELFDIDYSGFEFFGKFLFQNQGSNEMRLFSQLGPIVLPGGSFEMVTQAHQRISFYGTPGESASVTSFAMME